MVKTGQSPYNSCLWLVGKAKYPTINPAVTRTGVIHPWGFILRGKYSNTLDFQKKLLGICPNIKGICSFWGRSNFLYSLHVDVKCIVELIEVITDILLALQVCW